MKNCIITGFLIAAIPSLFIFLDRLDSTGKIDARSFILWLFLGALLSIACSIFNKQESGRKKKAIHYGARGFFSFLVISVFPIIFVLFNASGAGGFSFASVIYLVALSLSISLILSIPFPPRLLPHPQTIKHAIRRDAL